MDLLVSGKPALVARARAAMASRLTTSAAHLTISAEAQAIEDRLAALARPSTATPDRHRGSTTPRQPSSPLSTSSSPRSRSRTRSGRCSTDSASRSSVTCAPVRWPGTPWSERKRRVSRTKACSARWRTSAASSDRVRRRCWKRPQIARPPRRSIRWRLGVALGGAGRVRRGNGGAGGRPRAGGKQRSAGRCRGGSAAAHGGGARGAEAIQPPGGRSGALGHLVKTAARQTRGRGHTFRGFTPGRARVHERLHLRERGRDVVPSGCLGLR